MVEPIIFIWAKPSQNGPTLICWSWARKLKSDIGPAKLSQEGSNLILLEPSWAKKLKVGIAQAKP